ncbi:TPA: hypothetical protein ACXZUL_002366 [Salmonella enterica]
MSLKKERNQAITLVPVVLPAGPTGGVRGGIVSISSARCAVPAGQSGEVSCG